MVRALSRETGHIGVTSTTDNQSTIGRSNRLGERTIVSEHEFIGNKVSYYPGFTFSLLGPLNLHDFSSVFHGGNSLFHFRELNYFFFFSI